MREVAGMETAMVTINGNLAWYLSDCIFLGVKPVKDRFEYRFDPWWDSHEFRESLPVLINPPFPQRIIHLDLYASSVTAISP